MYLKSNDDWQLERQELMQSLDAFAALLKERPFKNFQGLRGVSAFALYWYLNRIHPAVVFEVGVWKGFSTWLIEQAVPQAEVWCFDPLFILEHLINRRKIGRTYRSRRAKYSYQDFSCADIVTLVQANGGSAVAFFDDHQNKMARLIQCRRAGIKHIIFDDNVAGCETHRSLEDDRQHPETSAVLEREVLSYEIFPALWTIDENVAGRRIREAGLGFPVEPKWSEIYDDRKWHSYVTYVRLR